MFFVHALCFTKPVKQNKFQQSKKEIFLKFFHSEDFSLRIKAMKIKLWIQSHVIISQ